MIVISKYFSIGLKVLINGCSDETNKREEKRKDKENPEEDLVEIGRNHFPLLDLPLLHLLDVVYGLHALYGVVEEVIEVELLLGEARKTRRYVVVEHVIGWRRWWRRMKRLIVTRMMMIRWQVLAVFVIVVLLTFR